MTIQTSGSEKRYVAVVLTAAADGFILPPMIIFRGKTNQTINDIEAPDGFVIVTQGKAWMDDLSGLIKYGNHMQKKNKRNWISKDR